MIGRFIILILILQCRYGFGQNYEAIIVQTWVHNEPPSQPGPPIFEIEYCKNKKGDLVADFYTVRAQKVHKKKLKEPKVITKEKLIRFQTWVTSNKRSFDLKELNIDKEQLNRLIPNARYQPHFQISNDFYIDTDSFKVCNDYQLLQSISTGGFTIKVMLKSDQDNSEFFKYASDDRGQHIFNLKDYLCIQPLFEEQIPDVFQIEGLFTRRTLMENVLYYKKVAECEGYYYQEFINKHPERSKQENRMMVGWDFENYLKDRNKK